MGGERLTSAVLALLLAGCAAPGLRWEPLSPVALPELGPPPEGETVALDVGDAAPWPGLLVGADYLAWLEAVAYDAEPLCREALAGERAGRAADREYASTAVDALRRAARERARLAFVAGLVAGGGGVGAVAVGVAAGR